MKKLNELKPKDKVLVWNKQEEAYLFGIVDFVEPENNILGLNGYKVKINNKKHFIYTSDESEYQNANSKKPGAVDAVINKPEEFFDFVTETSDVFRMNRW
ncbi:MAG: hypothetical protein IJU60_06045 [Acholeplasmatales bacterium]|nr:hypothetical protein [Acholeplasmatales bacterium]